MRVDWQRGAGFMPASSTAPSVAYTVVDYGSETPLTVDRFGTEQSYGVDGRNGAQRVRHDVTPVRSAPHDEAPTGPVRRFWWTFNRCTRHRSYRVLTHTGRSIVAHVDDDGRLRVLVDGATVHDERNR